MWICAVFISFKEILLTGIEMLLKWLLLFLIQLSYIRLPDGPNKAESARLTDKKKLQWKKSVFAFKSFIFLVKNWFFFFVKLKRTLREHFHAFGLSFQVKNFGLFTIFFAKQITNWIYPGFWVDFLSLGAWISDHFFHKSFSL